MKQIKRLIAYLQSVLDELKRVSFPTYQQTAKRTAIVVISIAIATVIIGLFDFGVTEAFKLIITKGE